MAKGMLRVVAVLAAVGAVPGCGGSDDAKDSPLLAVFYWAYLLGGGRSASGEATAVVEGSAGAGAVEAAGLSGGAPPGGVCSDGGQDRD